MKQKVKPVTLFNIIIYGFLGLFNIITGVIWFSLRDRLIMLPNMNNFLIWFFGIFLFIIGVGLLYSSSKWISDIMNSEDKDEG